MRRNRTAPRPELLLDIAALDSTNTSRPLNPARSGGPVLRPKGCGHKDSLPEERRRDLRMCHGRWWSPDLLAAKPAAGNPTAPGGRASIHPAHSQSPCVRSLPESRSRVGVGRQQPRRDGAVAGDRDSLPRVAAEPSHATGSATPPLVETPPDGTVRRSE